MRKQFFISTIVTMTFVIITTSNAQVYIADDFEGPAKSEGLWEIITGNWEVADGVLHQLAQGDSWLMARRSVPLRNLVCPDKLWISGHGLQLVPAYEDSQINR